MSSNQDLFLKILFNEGEHVYAAPDKFTSSKNDDGTWKNYRPSVLVEEVDKEKTVLISINPLKGDSRNDGNVTAYRSFLVEMDDGSLEEQMTTVESIGLPYSVCTFSGSKSLHFGIVLNEDLPSEELWRFYAEWIINTVPGADRLTKNPSRSIRFCDVIRPETGGKQLLVRASQRISLNMLKAYLSKHKDKMPVVKLTDDEPIPSMPNPKGLSTWVLLGLKNGFDFTSGRNNRWFSIAYDFGKNGYSLEETADILKQYYVEESDFRQTEWITALRSGWKKARKK